MIQEPAYTDLEIRILKGHDEGYPVKLSFREQTAEGYLSADVLSWRQTAGSLADGQELADYLFADTALREAWANFRGQSQQMRIRLRIDPSVPELHAIPWELLQLRGKILAADSDTPFSRYLPGEEKPGGPVAERPLKLLVAVANPDNLPENDLTPIRFADRSVIKKALAEVDDAQLAINHLEEPVTLAALGAELCQGYNLLHLIAHGEFRDGQITLFLANEKNLVCEVGEAEFVRVVARHRPQLVFLSSCDTGARSPADAWRGLAPQLINAGVPAVLAMQDKIPVETAREFSRVFYQQLLEDGRLDVASNRARATLLTENLSGASIPVLFSRLPHNRLFAKPQAARPQPATLEQRYRLDLLEQVRARWIAGVLEPSMQGVTRLEQTRQEQHEAVEEAFSELGMPDQPDRSLPPGQTMLDLFEEIGQGALLILGPPGSGKTTSLLELAAEAITRAEKSPDQPLPVVFKLTTWGDSKQSLADWLVAGLEKGYDVDLSVGRAWVERNRLLLLLDGLDKVEPGRQAACVRAINEFRATNGLTRLAVCCDANAYEALGVKLRLMNAIRLSPFTPPVTEAEALDLGPKADTVDLEIHILAEQAAGYPLELSLSQEDGQQREFSGGYLRTDSLPAFSDPTAPGDGETLFDWLFADPVLKCNWTQIRQGSRQRRIRLRIDPDETTAPELHALPWELLRDVSPGLPPQALATDGRTPFCRYRPGRDRAPDQPVTERPIKLLVAIADPPGLEESFRRPAPQPEIERQLMAEVLFGLEDKTEFRVTYLGLDQPLTLAALEAELRRDYHILHLVGVGAVSSHNQQGALLLAGSDQQQAQPVPAGKLVEMLANLGGRLPRLVVLSDGIVGEDGAPAPNSAQAWRNLGAILVEAGIPAVLAMQGGLTRMTAYQFFRSFYRQVVQSGQLDRVSNLARATLSTADARRPPLPPILFSRVVDLQLFAHPQRALSKAETEERRNQLILLGKVRTAWVEGVLEQSLHDVAMLELGKEAEAEAVERPLGLNLAPGQEMIDIFDQAGTLLILGAPGSGKTFALLELARDLIDRAEQFPDHPIPIVFNLSSWQNPKQSIADWMSDELSLKYQIPRKIGRDWIANNRILPLLDGLDEVRPELRADCVRAINAFRETHRLTGLAVCCRTGAYERLKKEDEVRLKLEGAIQLQHLSRQQIDNYLQAAGPQLAAVRQTLEHDQVLQEIAETPLMLNVMSLAYQGKSVEDLRGSDTVEERRKNLFEEYVQGMFERIARRKLELYPREQTIGWLTWLAGEMIEHNQTVFLVESLQPGWLSTYRQRRVYAIGSGLPIGLFVGLSLGLACGLFGAGLSDGLPCGLLSGLSGGLFFGLIAAGKFGLSTEIETGRTLSLSWDKARKGFTRGLLGGLLIVVPAALELDLQFWLGEGLPVGLLFGLIAWLTAGLLGGLLGGLVGLILGLTTKPIETRTKPNQGIRRSARSALLAGLLGGLLLGPLGFLLILGGKPIVGLIAALLGWLVGGLPVGLRYGGIACIQHFTLRFILCRNGYIPWNYIHFLDYATERIFLRKVGGGYIFIHRLLQEYFAELVTAE